jgi:tryptophanyl-tRNA synthetase
LIFTYIACGIDLNKTKMFFQSDVSAHPQLSWLLTCQTTIGELNRMTQFKDKSQKSAQNGTDYIPTGLLVYPPLMAADILLYDANFVPVGADQKQHLELTRDVAIRFNNKFGKTFTIPEPHISTVGAKIQDLKTPSKKMSKSSADPSGVIFLLDDPELAHKKIMTALTDNLNKVKFDPKTQPGISNLITIASCLTKKDIKEIEKKYSNIKNYGEFKRDIADGIKELLIKFQARYKKAQNEQDKILDKIAKITVECNKISQKKLSLVYDRMGIRPAAKIKK